MSSSTLMLKKQLDSLEPTQIQKFFAWFIPWSTPVMSYSPKNPCDGPADGLFIGTAAGSVLLPLALSFSAAIALPPTILAGFMAVFIVEKLRENNRDVELAKKEIDYLDSRFTSPTISTSSTKINQSSTQEVIKDKFNDAVSNFFEYETLEKYSKNNILSLILKHEDKDTKIALLEACLNKKTKLSQRMWKQEGFFACTKETGTLSKIQYHLDVLKGNRKPSRDDALNGEQVRTLHFARAGI